MSRVQFNTYCQAAQEKPAAKPAKAKQQAQQASIGELDIRVGAIVHVQRHPQADTLYVEKIDVGESEPRTIISGLVKYMKEDELRGKSVLVLCNLPAKEMRGIASNGMVLAASKAHVESGTSQVALVEPPPGVLPGERVNFEGFDTIPTPAISGNRLEKILKKCKILPDGTAVFAASSDSNVAFNTSKGTCKSTLTDASIS